MDFDWSGELFSRRKFQLCIKILYSLGLKPETNHSNLLGDNLNLEHISYKNVDILS